MTKIHSTYQLGGRKLLNLPSKNGFLELKYFARDKIPNPIDYFNEQPPFGLGDKL